MASGSVAAPRSPSEAPRASGAMPSEVTPVSMGLNSFFMASSAFAAGEAASRMAPANPADMASFSVFVIVIVLWLGA